jgi:hypothetical protein
MTGLRTLRAKEREGFTFVATTRPISTLLAQFQEDCLDLLDLS